MVGLNLTRRPFAVYIAPMATFLILTSLEGQLSTDEGGELIADRFVWLYTAKVVLTAMVLLICRASLTDYRKAPE